mmetsp:Transcript_14640/g.26908  ORF Transcript_14640/g.26908 Transcript_14640/m.26908 type:complete len:110 (-) Transcript_14640:28-357(-)
MMLPRLSHQGSVPEAEVGKVVAEGKEKAERAAEERARVAETTADLTCIQSKQQFRDVTASLIEWAFQIHTTHGLYTAAHTCIAHMLDFFAALAHPLRSMALAFVLNGNC